MLEQIARDIRHALRAMLRTPVLAAIVIVSLGVGIGVNTVVFSWIQAFVFRPIPGVDGASAIHLVESRAASGARSGSSWLEYQDLRASVRTLSDLSAFRMAPLNVGETNRSERTYALLVSGNYFSSLGLRPAAGRLLRPDEVTSPGREPVVVISYDYWQTRFQGSLSAVGQTLRVNDNDLTIVGVAPEGFLGTIIGLQFDLWTPATMVPVLFAGSRELEDRNLRGYAVMGRLGGDATLAAAQADVTRTMGELAQRYPDTNANVQADVLPFWRALRGPQNMLLQGVSVLQGVMLLLLLAVCGNTANLVLARASVRQREMGVRLAVGAGSWRILRLLLVENLVLGVVASALGVLIAVWGTNALRAVPFTTQFPVRFETSVNGAGLVFAVVLGMLCALIFGAAPAAQLARVDPQVVLRAGSAKATRGGIRSTLMAIEVGLALAVLIAAAIFFQSFRQTQDTDPGFRREGVLLTSYDFSGDDAGAAASLQFAARVLEQLRTRPDIEAAAISSSVPLDIHGLPARRFTVEGRAAVGQDPERIISNVVTPGYFAVMGIPFIAGSDFADLLDTAAPKQAIVNEEFVRRYLDGREAIGRRITVSDQLSVIAGVVRNSLYESFSEPATPIVYLSYRDRPYAAGEIHVRIKAGDEAMLGPVIRRAVRDINPALPVYNVRTMSQHVDMNLALRKIPARMFLVLGPLILVLAAIGIYAVVSYSVAQRTSEIGVRVALGASGGRVVSQIVRESLQVIATGAVVGWTVAAFVYLHLIRGGLDPVVFAGVPLLLLLVAALSSWVPARRAAAVDPMVALRAE